MATVDFDVVEGNDPRVLAGLCLGTDTVNYKVLQEVGPGGGHPVVRFTGSSADIVKVALAMAGCTDANVLDAVEAIQFTDSEFDSTLAGD